MIAADLKMWGLRARHPQDYLITLFEFKPEVVINKLGEIATNSNKDRRRDWPDWQSPFPHSQTWLPTRWVGKSRNFNDLTNHRNSASLLDS